MDTIIIANREVLCNDTDEWYKFQDWVEQTQLFRAIIQHSRFNNHTLHYGNDDNPGEERLRIDFNGQAINRFEELPIEILAKFYDNYPFKHQFSPVQKLLTNETQSEDD